MRIVRYQSPQGPRWGVLRDLHIVALEDMASDSQPGFDAVLQRAQVLCSGPVATAAALPIAAATLLAPVHPAATIYCVGLNYRAHADEAGRELPPYPSLFIRRHTSLVGSGQPLQYPMASQQLDFEGELAVVIGRGGRDIADSDAMAYISAYTCFNDGSVRDFQRQSLTAGKNFERSGACGPWLVSADEIADPTNLRLITRVNGEQMQCANTGQLIYPIAMLVSYISRFAQLRPGDLIATGTPEGVGAARNPPRWLVPSDRVTVEIDGIGTLDNMVMTNEGSKHND